MPKLDPHPTNELGRDILDSTKENELLERGIVYASRCHRDDGSFVLITCARPILIALEDAKEHGQQMLISRRRYQEPIAA